MKDFKKRIEHLVRQYGEGADGACPTMEQWLNLVTNTPEGSVTMINFFKMRDQADYRGAVDAPPQPGSGDDAFQRYAAVSGGVLNKVGGDFMLVAPFKGSLIGEPEDWDLIAIGTYPDVDAVLALFEDADYQSAFVHRSAACVRQKVFFC